MVGNELLSHKSLFPVLGVWTPGLHLVSILGSVTMSSVTWSKSLLLSGYEVSPSARWGHRNLRQQDNSEGEWALESNSEFQLSHSGIGRLCANYWISLSFFGFFVCNMGTNAHLSPKDARSMKGSCARERSRTTFSKLWIVIDPGINAMAQLHHLK